MNGGRLLEGWDRFWFAQIGPHVYAWLRIAMGLCVLSKLTGVNGLYRIHRWRLIFPWQRAPEGDEWLGNGEYIPRIAGLGWIPTPDDAAARTIASVCMVFALAMVVGLGTRFVVPVVTLLIGWLSYYSSMDYRHHENVLFWMLVVLCFAPCGRHHSLDRALFALPSTPVSTFPLRMMQVLVSAIYLSTTVGKLGDGWWSGEAMRELYEGPHMKGPFVEVIYSVLGPVFLSRYTLLVEGLCSFGLWMPVLRLPTALLGIALHLGIDSVMSVTTFSYQMIASYLAFTGSYAWTRGSCVALDGRSAASDHSTAPADPATG